MQTELARITLPRLALVADAFTRPEHAAHAIKAAEAGIPWVHLRDHEAPPAVFDASAKALAGSLRRHSCLLLSVNGQLDTAESLRAGIHLGARGPSVGVARRRLGRRAIIGVSVHNLKEGHTARHDGADYCFLSPIFPTRSKPGHPGLGLAALRSICAALAPLPVLALGGIRSEHVASCLQAGAYGVVVLSGILGAEEPDRAASAYLDALHEVA